MGIAAFCLALGRLASAAEVDGPAAVPTGQSPLTLPEAIRLARSSSPDLRAAQARLHAARGRHAQAGLWSNPDLEFSAEDWRVSGGNSGFSSAKQMAGVSQTVPFPGKKSLDRQIGGAEVRVLEADFAARRLRLERDVKIAFYQVLAAERLIAVQRELVKVAEASASNARTRVEAGAAPDQEQLRAELPLEQARTELGEFQRDLAIARRGFATLLGRPDLKDVPIAGVLEDRADFSLVDREPDQWLSKHPNLQSARANQARAELGAQRARLEPYPDVTLGLAGGREGGAERSSLIEFRVAVPVPIIDRSKGRKQEARANVALAAAELATVEQALLREWDEASHRLRTAADQVAKYRDRILPKAAEALRLVQSGFEEGKFGFIDLLDTQRTAAEARLAYQRKLLDLNVARAELESLILNTP